jgi:hypothetical protein
MSTMARSSPLLLTVAMFCAGCAAEKSTKQPARELPSFSASASPSPAAEAPRPSQTAAPAESGLQGTWERKINGGRVIYEFKGQEIRAALMDDRTGEMTFELRGDYHPAQDDALFGNMTHFKRAAASDIRFNLEGTSLLGTLVEACQRQGDYAGFIELEVEDKNYDLHIDVGDNTLTVTDFHLQGCGPRLQQYLEGRFTRVAGTEPTSLPPG